MVLFTMVGEVETRYGLELDDLEMQDLFRSSDIGNVMELFSVAWKKRESR